MKFLTITLIVPTPDPVTGVQKSTHEQFQEVIDNALLSEELGFDGFGVGERHERPFISSSPTVVLNIAPALRQEIPNPPWAWGPAPLAAVARRCRGRPGQRMISRHFLLGIVPDSSRRTLDHE